MTTKEKTRIWHNFRNNIGYAILRDDQETKKRLEAKFKKFCNDNNLEYPERKEEK